MKKNFFKILLPFFTVLLVSFYACNKDSDPNLPPVLELKTGPGYTSDSIATVNTNTAIKVGVHAEAGSSQDYLNTFTVSHAFDGNDIEQDSSRVLTQDERNGFEEDIYFATRYYPGKEVYYFTVTNLNGVVVTKT